MKIGIIAHGTASRKAAKDIKRALIKEGIAVGFVDPAMFAPGKPLAQFDAVVVAEGVGSLAEAYTAAKVPVVIINAKTTPKHVLDTLAPKKDGKGGKGGDKPGKEG